MDSPTATIVVMGVTGCGKTTVGTLLAQHLAVPYLDADDFHPAANVTKMRAGTPLTDEDRQPWLATITEQIAASTRPRPVLSCSALKRQYRNMLRQADPRVWFLHLVIDEATAFQRVARAPATSCARPLSPPSSPCSSRLGRGRPRRRRHPAAGGHRYRSDPPANRAGTARCP